MPIDYKTYPKNWKWLSKQIRNRADNRCELCGKQNNIYIWYKEAYPYCWGYHTKGDKPPYENCKIIKVVLTVHHINFNKNDNHELNLIALCQRCHLRLDIREKLRKITRNA